MFNFIKKNPVPFGFGTLFFILIVVGIITSL